jgi:four helix bundle protein
MLSYEKLDVYQCAVRFLALSSRLVSSWPKGNAALVDQLRRAALSIPLNIAEAAGKTTVPDRARYYAVARGSAMECAAIVEVSKVLGYTDDAAANEGKDLLVRVVKMLSKMCR